MVYIDHKKMAEEGKKDFDKLMARRDKIYGLYETNKKELLEKKLCASVIPLGSAGIEYGFRGNLSLEKCFFDDGELKEVGGATTFSSTEGFPRGLYECEKCRMLYDVPLSTRDRKRYEKALKEMVFG